MRVVVLGAGVIGVCSAWYLARAGYQVTVVDRACAAAQETSFANAGQLSYGYTTPWAAPGIPLKAVKWLFKRHSPLLLRPDGSWFQLKWLMQMLGQCRQRPYRVNKERMVRISEYSRTLLAELQRELSIDFEARQLGTLQLFRTQQQIDAAQSDILVLEEYQVPHQLLSARECYQFEPGLQNAKVNIAGALHLPHDGTGDCYLFSQQMARECEKLGVEFAYQQHIGSLEQQAGKIRAIHCGDRRFAGDIFVCALGAFSRQLMQHLALEIPVYPIKGYSITSPIIDPARAPQSTILDETYKVAITRFNERIRVGGMAELSGYQIKLSRARQETLSMVQNDLFPDAADMSELNLWSGLRAMPPDSVPIIGNVKPYQNLWLNTAYGTLGFTMCLGGSKILADLISGEPAAIKTDDLNLSRFD